MSSDVSTVADQSLELPQALAATETLDVDAIGVKGDCYSAGERAWMEYGQRLRGDALRPLLVALTKFHVTPDHLTIASVLAGLCFAPLWFSNYPWIAVSLLWLHILFDGLDGPLARYQETASPRGSFTDSFCDQVVVSVATIALMIQPSLLSVWAGSIYLVAYTGVLAIAMVRNTLQIPYSWLIRPRLFVFIAIPIELLGVRQAIETVVWLSNIFLGIKLVSGFWKLRKRLAGPTNSPSQPKGI